MPASQPPTGHIKLQVEGLGVVEGLNFPNAQQFCGIPYATLKKRWTRSVLKSSWPTGYHDGTKLGAPNPPEYNTPEDPLIPVDIAPHFTAPVEDELSCLIINITMPPLRIAAKLPVMLYIHGGSFLFGGANKGVFDGVNFVSHSVERGTPVVAVCFNYRVGLGGFLASSAIKAELQRDGFEGVGNFGLYDQQVAIQWVSHYIASFGGDPDNVTIYGESAGGMSVSHQLAARHPAPFKRAICMSGQLNTIPTWSIDRHEKRFNALLRYLGINPASPTALQELRAVPDGVVAAATIPIEGVINATGNPCDDGYFHAIPPAFDRIASPPLWLESYMVGDTGDEGVIFHDSLADDDYDSLRCQMLAWLSPDMTDTILELYGVTPNLPHGEIVHRMEEMAADALFKAHNWIAVHRSQIPSTFGYHFDQVCTHDSSLKGLSYHAIDLLYLFLNFDERFSLCQRKVARAMANHLIDFAYGKDPWPRVSSDTQWMRYGPNEVIQVVREQEDENIRKYTRMEQIMQAGAYDAFFLAMDDIAGKRQLLGAYLGH